MATGSTSPTQPVALLSQTSSYAGVAKAFSPPKATGSLAGWNANVKIVSPGKSKTSTSPPRLASLPPQPVPTISAKSAPLADQRSLRVPRYTKTTAPVKKASPKPTTTFKFVANGPSPKSNATFYAPPSLLARPKAVPTSPPLETKIITAAGPVAGVKGTSSDSPSTVVLKTVVGHPIEAKKSNLTGPVAVAKNAEDIWTEVKKASTKTKTKVAAAQPEIKLPELARSKSNQNKESKVPKAPVLHSSSIVDTKHVDKKHNSKPASKKVATKPITKKIQTEPATKKSDSKIAKDKKVHAELADKKIEDSGAATATTVVPAARQDVASTEDFAQNSLAKDSVVAASTEQEQGVSPSSQTSDPSDHIFPDLATADGQTEATSAPKKKKRNQKSGAQRKKEARGRALAEPSLNIQVEDGAATLPLVAPQDAARSTAVPFVDTQIAVINVMARIDASKYPLNSSLWRLENMAKSVPSIKESRRNLEEALRTALLDLIMRGIHINVREETYDLSDAYVAQHGEEITEGDEKRMDEVANHAVRAFRNVCCNLEVHVRAAKALEERKSKPVASVFQGQDMPSTSDFQFSVPGAIPVLDAGASPAGQPVDFTLPPSGSTFNFSMPSGASSLGNSISTVEQPEFKNLPFVFSGSAVAAGDELELSTNLPDTDTSESDDTTFHSEDSDSSATEDECPQNTIQGKKNEPCLALTKYHGPSLSTATVTVPLFGHQQSSLPTEDGLQEEAVQAKAEPCLAMTKYHGSLLTATTDVVPLLSDELCSPATEDAAAPATTSEQPALIHLPQNRVARSIAVKLSTPLQALQSRILPLKMDFDYRLPPQALQVLDVHGSYTIPSALKLEAPPTEAAAVVPTEAAVAVPTEDATVLLTEDAAALSVESSKAMVPYEKPHRVPRAPSTPEQRGQQGPYRLNVLLGTKTLNQYLHTLADPLAYTYTRAELIEAFVTLSSRERTDVDIGFPHPWTTAGVLNNKRLANRILLGSITLAEFLGEIVFDEQGIATDSDVLGAWEVLAKKDDKWFEAELARENR
jgi:hypothetical protein